MIEAKPNKSVALLPRTPEEVRAWEHVRPISDADRRDLIAWISSAVDAGHKVTLEPDDFVRIELTPGAPLQVTQEVTIAGDDYLAVLGVFLLPRQLFRATGGQLITNESPIPKIARYTLSLLTERSELADYAPTPEDAQDAIARILLARSTPSAQS